MSRNMTYGFNPNKEKVPVWDEEYVSNNFQKVIYKDNIAVIYANGDSPDKNSESLNFFLDINYPTGFNQTNCCIISLMSYRTNRTDPDWATTEPASSSAYLLGNGDLKAILRKNHISVSYCKYDTAEPSIEVAFRVVLMKLPTYDLTGMYKGDVNEDGQVTTADANIVNDYTNGDGSLTEKQYRLADINPINGIVDKNDVLKIQSVATGYSEPELFNEENQ